MWGNSPTSQLARPGAPGTARKSYRAPRAESIRSRETEIGHHAAVQSTRGAVAIEGWAVVRAAPAGARDALDAQPLAVTDQLLAEIEVPGTRAFGRLAAAGHDLRTNFIAGAANPYAKVH